MCSLIGEQHLGMLEFDVAPARNLMSTVSSLHYRQLQSNETLKEQNFCITSHIPSISPTRSFRGPPRATMRMARQRTSDKSLSCVIRVARLILAETTGLSFVAEIELDVSPRFAEFQPERPDTGEICIGVSHKQCCMDIWNDFERNASGIVICADHEIAAFVEERQ